MFLLLVDQKWTEQVQFGEIETAIKMGVAQN